MGLRSGPGGRGVLLEGPPWSWVVPQTCALVLEEWVLVFLW